MASPGSNDGEATAARWLLAGLLAATACRDAPAGSPAEAPGADAPASSAAAGAPAARRPARRYYFAHTSARCEVYSVERDQISPPVEVPCPADLALGERIRLTGKTCMRESPSDPAREVPVVCPDPLTLLEEDDLEAARDAGR
jgi:hypothetical protein